MKNLFYCLLVYFSAKILLRPVLRNLYASEEYRGMIGSVNDKVGNFFSGILSNIGDLLEATNILDLF